MTDTLAGYRKYKVFRKGISHAAAFFYDGPIGHSCRACFAYRSKPNSVGALVIKGPAQSGVSQPDAQPHRLPVPDRERDPVPCLKEQLEYGVSL